jgi:predicted MFS family arabinose efflux permease
VKSLRVALLGSAVAVAFADSSIVVLALPELIRRFDASVVEVAWIVTSYNVAVLLGAVALVGIGRRIDPWRLTRLGVFVFLFASIACAFSPSLPTLVAWRGVQGLGGAALLAGSLPLMRALAANPSRGTGHWALMGTLGAALGPAAGGALTDALDWRAIFIAQAPVAALALLALRTRFGMTLRRWAAQRSPATQGFVLNRVPTPVSGLAFTHDRQAGGRQDLASRLWANVALALLSGALVGALFLVVVLLIDVWGYTPLGAATIVSAIPAGTLAGHLLAHRRAVASAAGAGSLLLVFGLGSVALVPGSEAAWVLAGLALCGLGLGLAVPGLSRVALDRSATWSIAARHLGLVGGLLLLTPLLAQDLTTASAKAQRAGTAAVLDSAIPIETKVPLAFDLASTIRRTPDGSLPDFSADFSRRSNGSPGLAHLERSLDETVRAVVTRGFRRALLLAAMLAAPVCLALLWARNRRRLVSVAIAGAALLAAQVGAGGLSYGAAPARDPCRAPSTLTGGGLDPTAQRVVLRGLDKAACRFGTSREQLLIDMAKGGAKAERWFNRAMRVLS